MSFSMFLRGFLVAIAIFAVVTYVVTQSLATTVINTLICAVLIQVGYAVAVLWMVARTTSPTAKDPQNERGEASGIDASAPKEPAGRIGNVPNSRHL